MKRFLMILGGAFLVLIVAGVIGFAIIATKGNALDKESKQYADTAITAIISSWDRQAIVDRASPEFTAAVNGDDLNKLMNMFQRLGKLRECKGAEGQANISVTPQHGKVVTAYYTAKAEFESGPALIQLYLIKHDDKWQIEGFRINSKVFLQ